jgi:hypothetical protein
MGSGPEQIVVVFDGIPPIYPRSNDIKSITIEEYRNNKNKYDKRKLWLLKKNTDTYDGTYVMINIIKRTPLLSELLFHLEANGFRLGLYDSVGEKKYDIIEALVENKFPEYCEVHLEASRSEEVAREILDFLARWGKRIAISSV